MANSGRRTTEQIKSAWQIALPRRYGHWSDSPSDVLPLDHAVRKVRPSRAVLPQVQKRAKSTHFGPCAEFGRSSNRTVRVGNRLFTWMESVGNHGQSVADLPEGHALAQSRE